MKAISTYFREDLEAEVKELSTRGCSTVALSEFQDGAVQKPRRLLACYDEVMIADSVGPGKTRIGKKLLEEYAYHQWYQGVILCPAALQKMWQDELMSEGIAATILTQEVLGCESVGLSTILDADLFLIDESHTFRNRFTQRHESLERPLAANRRQGKISEQRKKHILLVAKELPLLVSAMSGGISWLHVVRHISRITVWLSLTCRKRSIFAHTRPFYEGNLFQRDH